MRKLSRTLVAVMATAVIGASAPSAEAAMILALAQQGGGGFVFVTDGGINDSNPADGAITFIGSVGVFDLNVSTALSKPFFENTSGSAKMDLNSINSSDEAGTLLIGLVDTDFLATGSGTLTGNVGGTTNGSVTFAGFKCEGNEIITAVESEQECSQLVTVLLGPFDDPAFSDSVSASHGPLGSYSMGILAAITHGDGRNSTSFDFELVNVPEPASMALLGLGLLGFGAASRRRKVAR